MTMFEYAYERLSAQDNSFLLLERPTVYMHVAATSIYDAGPLKTPDGGIDIEKLKQGVALTDEVPVGLGLQPEVETVDQAGGYRTTARRVVSPPT